ARGGWRTLVGALKPKMFGGAVWPNGLPLEPKTRRAGLCLVAADAFESAEAVLERIAHHMDMRIPPIDDVAVHPDLFCSFQASRSPLIALRSSDRSLHIGSLGHRLSQRRRSGAGNPGIDNAGRFLRTFKHTCCDLEWTPC